MPTNGHTNGHAGWELPEARATLVLDTPPYAGAEIECRLSLTPGTYFGVRQWLGQVGSSDGPNRTDDVMTASQEVGKLFAQYGLVSWNLTRNGEPIPATVEGVLSLDIRLIMEIAATWLGSIGTVPVPLPEASTPGRQRRAKTSRRQPSTAGSSTGASSQSRPTTVTSAGSSGFSN